MLELGSVKTASNSSITAAVPITEKSARTLELTIADLLEYQSVIREVVILCPELLLSTARSSIHHIVASYGRPLSTLLTLLPCAHATCSPDELIETAFYASTDWTLFLDDSGLRRVHKAVRPLLLNPPAVTFPLGLDGFALPNSEARRGVCLTPFASHRPAGFLVPPFVLPSCTFSDAHSFPDLTPDSWSALGRWVSEKRPDTIGGVIISRDSVADDCFKSNYSEAQNARTGRRLSTLPIDDYHSPIFGAELSFANAGAQNVQGRFGIFFPTLDDLAAFSQVACRLVIGGHRLNVFLYTETDQDQSFISTDTCTLRYLSSSSATSASLPGFPIYPDPFDVLITVTAEDIFTVSLLLAIKDSAHAACTVIRLPGEDLIYSDWMGTLSFQEWKSWNVPRIDISIITNNRPNSLSRLARSLENARYFGDTLDLRLNMEDSADLATKQLVGSLKWRHGATFVHHRITHGGLLTAVVESWYPRSNDSYGVVLEDDVEVSPLFYAWVKLALLHYRYGNKKDKSPLLFGISLYQQKNLELHIEGRRSFNARWLFDTTDMAPPNTPYLSQIPCSWGAVYFPEHWREFHTYVACRLTDPSLSLKENIVPNVRSSRWQHSWKKYFIEMIFLRGYTMLYPNYANFSSLSTNHLEPGAHVKRLPRDVFEKKRAQFDLPLMPLPDIDASGYALETGLLDLPESGMPGWDALPVLDLHGSIVSEELIVDRGQTRRPEVFGCTDLPTQYDALSLLCL
ncbi:hypothetical protein F5148DRAFT_983589 [Russula earlei]|uniref:Uncharacterized protein n=1 Tax=Russula earlei TaxID=71964 RepID=A0ACC0U2Q7_9AGAM|nr:hypothetical protein F5148DRAFT_983589 [Russula earlei]